MSIFYPLKKVNNQKSVPVSATPTLVLPANPQRKYALLVNQSKADFWIKFDANPAVCDGIFIAKNGFAYEIDNNNLWVGSVYAISDGSPGVNLMSVLELS